jgi:hypothetical protein
VIILVAEEKCAETLQAAFDAEGVTEYIASCWPGGEKAFSKVDFLPLGDRDVIYWPDHDKAGFDVPLPLGELLTQARVHSYKIVRPDRAWPLKHDIADLLLADGWTTGRTLDFILGNLLTVQDFAVDATKAFQTEAEPAAVGDIDVESDPMEQQRGTIEALRVANSLEPRLYIRGGVVTRLTKGNGRLNAEVLSAEGWQYEIGQAAKFIKRGKNHDITVRAPRDLIRELRGTPASKLPFPELAAISDVPFFSPDGLLISTPGYHIESLTYRHPDATLRSMATVSANPTADECRRALEIIGHPISQFPWADAGSRANAIALGLLGFARPLIQGSIPFTAIDAPTEGTGKGLLASTLCTPVLGCEIPTSPEPSKDSDETRKLLTACALSGRTHVLFDNLTRVLDSGEFAAILTGAAWTGRILGTNDLTTDSHRMIFIVTGNRLRYSPEIRRRRVPISLDAKMEQPSRRTFKFNPVRYVLEHRAEQVWAYLTLVQNWIAQGRLAPKQSVVMGPFDAFVEVIGGILTAAGIGGFLSNLETSDDSDSRDTAWQSFIEAWFARFGEVAQTPAELLKLADEENFMPEKSGESNRARTQRLGHGITRHNRSTFEIDDGDGGVIAVQLVRASVRRNDEKGRTSPSWRLARVNALDAVSLGAPAGADTSHRWTKGGTQLVAEGDIPF